MKKILRLTLTVISMLIYNLSVIVFSWCFKLITDSLIDKEYSAFGRYILLSVFVVMVQAAGHYIYIKGKTGYIKNELMRIKSGFIESIFNYDVSDFMNRDKSEYQSFLFHDMNIYEQKILSGRFELAEKLVLMILSTAAIMMINIDFVVLVLLLAVVSVIIPLLFGKTVKKLNTLLSRTNSRAMDKFDEMLDGFITLRTFSAEAKGIGESKEAVEENENAKMKYSLVMAVFQSALILVTTVFTLMIFIWGGQSVIREVITVGELIALIQLLFNVEGPLMGVMTALGNIKAAKPIADKYEEYVQTVRTDGDADFSLEKNISVNHLYFGYSEGKDPVLDDINCEFEKGKKYAIVGENGSGKSTLLKVLAGVNDIHSYKGEINIDGIERKKIKDTGFWKNVSYLPQQVFLFKNTIADNVFMAGKTESDENFLELASSLDTIKLVKDDSESKTDELSGGERQRIAFLREMLKGASVLMADEPDSALDVETGSKIRDIMLGCDKTCIVVTHRIGACLAGFDKILVMAGGKIVESGTYESLMGAKGYFYDISLREKNKYSDSEAEPGMI